MAASCTQCGGHVAVTLAGPPISCPYCGSDAPLPADVASKVDQLRGRVARRVAQDQHLVGRQTHIGDVFGLFFLFAMLSVLVVLGAPALFAIDLPEGMSVTQFLFEPIPAPDDFFDLGPGASWWYLFTLITFAALTVWYWSLTQLRLRRIVTFTYPEAPLAPGRPPRCRVCGAELPTEGTIRRCSACTADHVVAGERYQKTQGSLEAALDDHAGRIDKTLADREKDIEGFVGFAGVGSIIAVIVGALAGALAGETRPVLWAIVGGLVALTAITIAIPKLLYPAPKIRGLYSLVPGDRLSIRGTVRPVAAVLRPDAAYAQSADYIALLGTGADLIAVGYQYDGDGRFTARGYTVSAGGEAREQHAELTSFEPKPDSTVLVRGDAKVWSIATSSGVRLWSGKPKVGAAPELTLAPMELSGEDVFLLDADR
jgi:hypothetical protein